MGHGGYQSKWFWFGLVELLFSGVCFETGSHYVVLVGFQLTETCLAKRVLEESIRAKGASYGGTC